MPTVSRQRGRSPDAIGLMASKSADGPLRFALLQSRCQFQPTQGDTERFMAYVIAEPCIGTKDSACVDACPVDCIHPKKDESGFADQSQLFIDPVECIDCGACVPVCPVSAIFAADDLPEKWKNYEQLNAQHFGR